MRAVERMFYVGALISVIIFVQDHSVKWLAGIILGLLLLTSLEVGDKK